MRRWPLEEHNFYGIEVLTNIRGSLDVVYRMHNAVEESNYYVGIPQYCMYNAYCNNQGPPDVANFKINHDI